MFDNIINGIKGAFDRMFGRKNFSAAALPQTAITDDMAAAIDRWLDLYHGRAPWLAKNSLSMGLPAAIAREIATLVTLECRIQVGNVVPEGMKAPQSLSPRAQFISDSLKQVIVALPVQTEYACAFGGIALRPYISGKGVCVDFLNADNFYPTAFNARGEITGAIFVEKKKQRRETFIRVEEHAMSDDGGYVITNRAFRSYGDSDIGTPCGLTDVDEWKEIQPQVTLKNVPCPLFAYFKIPQGNVVDSDSPLGVSVYARADQAGVLREADMQFQRLSWEYEGGEMAVDASYEAFRPDKNGRPVLPEGKERLFRVNEASGDQKLQVFAPALRDSSYSEGLNRLLMRVEDLCGIARGTFSDANESVRTATELRISKQRTYATVTAIQMSLQAAIDALARAMDVLADLYELAPSGEYTISYTWDDSIVVDADSERQKDRDDVADGLMQPWEYRVKWYGESESKAKEALEGISDKPVADAVVRTDDEEETEEE